MNTLELMDTMSKSGNTFEGFRSAILDIDSSTYVVDLTTSEISLLSYVRTDDEKEKLIFNIHSPQTIVAREWKQTNLPLATLMKIGGNERFVQEIVNGSKLLMRLGGEGCQYSDLYFTSTRLSRDLGARAQLSGDAIYEPTNERDTYIAHRYLTAPVKTKAVIRHDAGNRVVHKIFALPSDSYCYIPQSILIEMAGRLKQELGNFTCLNWEVNHFVSQISLLFPEAAEDMCDVYGLPDKFIPGITLKTSDTGDCSVKAIAFWYKDGKAKANVGRFEREHKGRVCEKVLLDNLSKQILPTYLALPARLAELLLVNISDSTAAIEKIFKMVNMTKVLGTRRCKNLLSAMCDEVATRPTMTGYELATLFLDLPNRFVGDESCLEAIENVVGKVPFLDFDKLSTATTAVVLA